MHQQLTSGGLGITELASAERKQQQMASLIVSWIEQGRRPRKRGVVKAIGGGLSAKWLNEGFATIQLWRCFFIWGFGYPSWRGITLP